MSRILALVWSVSVMIPAWLPVNDEACDAAVRERHAEQRRRDPLPDRREHVELSRWVDRRDVAREAQQVVGGLAHRRDHDHDVVAGALRARHVVGDRADPIGVADGRPPVLLDDERHDLQPTECALRDDRGHTGPRDGPRIGSAPCRRRSDSDRRKAAATGSRRAARSRSAASSSAAALIIVVVAAVVVGSVFLLHSRDVDDHDHDHHDDHADDAHTVTQAQIVREQALNARVSAGSSCSRR